MNTTAAPVGRTPESILLGIDSAGTASSGAAGWGGHRTQAEQSHAAHAEGDLD